MTRCRDGAMALRSTAAGFSWKGGSCYEQSRAPRASRGAGYWRRHWAVTARKLPLTRPKEGRIVHCHTLQLLGYLGTLPDSWLASGSDEYIDSFPAILQCRCRDWFHLGCDADARHLTGCHYRGDSTPGGASRFHAVPAPCPWHGTHTCGPRILAP